MKTLQSKTEHKRPSKHQVWDKPIQNLMWDLRIDPRIPKECNQVMIELIRQTESSQPTFKGENYRRAASDEMSEAGEFQWNSEVQKEPVTRLRIPDKSEICLAAMREKYEQTKSIQGQYNKDHIPWKQKEKWKEISLALSEEDIP